MEYIKGPRCTNAFSMLEHRINLTQNLLRQCEFKSMLLQVSESSHVKLAIPTPGLERFELKSKVQTRLASASCWRCAQHI
jgi:hypothetical protein